MVQSENASVTLLFCAQAQYQFPESSRGYVWTLDNHVARLWMDLEDEALRWIASTERAKTNGIQPMRPFHGYFLGPIVLAPIRIAIGRQPVYDVIDGQQRITTLHLLLLALKHATQKLHGSHLAQALEVLVRNKGSHAAATDNHKVWPIQAGTGQAVIQFLDSDPDIQSVLANYPVKQGSKSTERPLMVQAYLYLYHACLAFLRGKKLADPMGPESDQTYSDALIHAIRHGDEIDECEPGQSLQTGRGNKLLEVLQYQVQVAKISLAPTDNAEGIFKALNTDGKPLLASESKFPGQASR